MKSSHSGNKIKGIVTSFIALLILSSCGFQNKQSADYSEYERPHFTDKGYIPYGGKPIYSDNTSDDGDDSSDDDIIIIDSEEPVGQDTITKIEHCIDTTELSNLAPRFGTENKFEAFNLALYITGTFEGKSVWANLASNSDGQGISLGRFQQNLGQGSLQPLLIKLITKKTGILDKHFSSNQKRSLLVMLNAWESGEELQFAKITKREHRFIASKVEDFTRNQAISSKARTSVEWALNTLFTASSPGEVFKPEWKKSLKSLASDADYINIQKEAVITLHKRALNYMRDYATKSLVSYLFFFDIVVQNGSMSVRRKDNSVSQIKYTKQLASLSETNKLNKLLKLRASKSKKEHQADVLARKGLIISGQSVFRGKDRSLPEETCLNNWSEIIL